LIKADECYNPSITNAPQTLLSSTKLASLTTKSKGRSGYLFRRSIGVFNREIWSRIYISLEKDILLIDDERIDLRICMVRTVVDERTDVFEILSPSAGIFLQAENPDEMREWISALEGGITRVLQGHSPVLKPVDDAEYGDWEVFERDVEDVGSGVKTVEVLRTLASVDGNGACADCGSSKNVDWASVNLGIMLCITCCGAHRGLGRGVSKVKSAELDRWDASTLRIMELLGNEKVNLIYEAALEKKGSTWKKLSEDSGQTERELFAKKKWSEKLFCLADEKKSSVSAQSVCLIPLYV
jgi:Arf-GAP/coiled-coil/ANK repeat/PH domain-containing protein